MAKLKLDLVKKLREIYYLVTPDTTQVDPVTECSLFFEA